MTKKSIAQIAREEGIGLDCEYWLDRMTVARKMTGREIVEWVIADHEKNGEPGTEPDFSDVCEWEDEEVDQYDFFDRQSEMGMGY